jgi:hexosaminidase
MKKLRFATFILFTFFALAGFKSNKTIPEINIIPKPSKIHLSDGYFSLKKDIPVFYTTGEKDLKKEAGYLVSQLNSTDKLSAKALPETNSTGKSIILKLTNDKELGNEGYKLNITENNILITAPHPAGIFYGTQSLLQLLPPEFFDHSTKKDTWQVPMCQITDKPRFGYRGMHLDVGRHFFPPKFIKHYLDMLAMYKYNTFHWHLTEDQGWRIEIKKYPELTEIGAWRDSTVVGRCCKPPLKYDGKRYGGFYTQDQIRDIVKYAADRHITIIPEIEMPGHCMAALASYPELACTPGPFKVATRWGVFYDVYCPKEETFRFLEDVLTEVMELFPGKYIHIGGDEVPKKRWKESAFCQNLIKKEGLKNEEELQSWFIRKIEKFLNAHGRQLIGWDEILEGGLSEGATVMSWRGIEGGIAAAKQHHDAIMTPGSHCYFDHYQADPQFQPLAIGGFTTLKKVYSYEPVPAELTPAEAKHILGAQGNVWTEYIPDGKKVEYMALPRMAALAEVDWTGAENKDWHDFQRRINNHFKRYESLGYNYCKGSYKVDIITVPGTDANTVKVTLESEIYKPEIRYTLNGDIPGTSSPVYKKPFTAKKGDVIKAAVFVDGKLMEKAAEKKL